MYSALQLLDRVNACISGLDIAHSPENLYAPVEYVLSLGGKRIRPVLMLLGYNLYKDDVQPVMPQAVALEVYHNYTLLHDDVMDHSDMRRGKPTVHKVWNENTAILSGDAMLVLAYRLLSRNNPPHFREVLELFSQTALEICEGQQYDMDFETRNDVAAAEYIHMIRLKTAVLLAASLKMGAILADAPSEDARVLYDFGINMGIAFQLKDDYLDVYGDPAVFGKKIGGDILCNKKTYMLIEALERADASQRKQLEDWLGKTDYVPSEKIAAVTRLYDEVGIKGICENKMREYYASAIETLSGLSVADEKVQALRKFAEHLMYREM